jgi:hypothetical protein
MVDVPKNVIALFDALIGRGELIKEACKKLYFAGSKKAIDVQSFEAWRTSCLTLLRSTFGTSSPHYDSFTGLKFFDHYNSTLLYLGILQSAREDIRKGYFYHKDLMLSVNVFSSFLQQAALLATRGEYLKAAGILEAVIAEALRKLADSEGLPLEAAAGIPGAAEALFGAGTLTQESRDRIRDLSAFLEHGVGTHRDEGSFTSWREWVNGFVYEQLGSRIVIVN